MKKIIYILLAILAFYSCEDKIEGFAPNITSEAFSFTPTTGGAILNYKLVPNSEVVAIKIRYKDSRGKELIRSGSIHCDTLNIIGFDEARQDVPAYITLCKADDSESTPIQVSFNTEDSAPIAFLKSVDIKPGWNGFSISYKNPKKATGLAHIFYLGENPFNNEPDTVWLSTIRLTEGADTVSYELKQISPENTVIIRTEDRRGYIVKEEKWEKIASLNTTKLDPKEFDFYDNGLSVEREEYKIGKKYLFDGDLKGETWIPTREFDKYYTFASKEDAYNKPMYIDLRKSTLVARLRIYCLQNIDMEMGWGTFWVKEFYKEYPILLPCSFSVYGAKDTENPGNWENMQWKRLGVYDQDPELQPDRRWCYNANYNEAAGYQTYFTAEELAKADPIYFSTGFAADGQGDGYRYLKLVVHDTFRTTANHWLKEENDRKHFSFHELEVYTKQ